MNEENITEPTTEMDAAILSAVIVIENLQTRWLVELGDRFYPFDPDVALKLEACSKKVEQGQEKLTALYTERFGAQLRPIDTSHYRTQFKNRFVQEDHFLVLTRATAYRCLTKIHIASMDILRFFKWASHNLQEDTLSAYANALVFMKEVLVMILSHYLSQFRQQTSFYGSTKLLPGIWLSSQ